MNKFAVSIGRLGSRAVLWGGLGALALQACQFPEYDLAPPGAGGEPGGGNASAGGEGGGGFVSCGTGKVCATAVPDGWLGPVAFWQSMTDAQASLPDCPDGYGDPVDLHRELTGPALECECACKAQGQVCDKTAALSIYLDLACQTECTKASPLECTAVTGCNGNQGTMRAEKPTPSGGSCKASVTHDTPEAPAWQYDARVCTLSSPDAQSCRGAGELCAPTPTLPYVSQLCVVRAVPEGQAVPACPDEYPNSTATLYAAFTDDRDCSACTCSGPTGGSCSGSLTLTSGQDCGSGVEYTLGSKCQPFALPSQPTNVKAQYTLEPGECGVASDSQPTGSARPSGSATVVCCL